MPVNVCLVRVGVKKKCCGLLVNEIRSYGGDLIGHLCERGHPVGISSPVRLRRCKGCGSHVPGRHATGCWMKRSEAEKVFEWICSQADFAGDDRQWEAVQERIEQELLPYGLDITGGPL